MKRCAIRRGTLIVNFIVLTLVVFESVSWAGEESSNPSRPNVIVFLVDDMGVMDTSVPFLTDSKGTPKRYPLNDFYHTPNMQRLADQGIRFSQFYAMSVCSPTRVSIMTGQNAARHHTTQWISPEKNNHGEFGPRQWNWRGPDSNTLTLARLLQSNGYRTIHVGKGHFGPFKSAGADPRNLGFDINVGGRSIGAPGSYFGTDHFGNTVKGKKPRNKKRKRDRAVPHLEKYHGTQTHLTDALTTEALDHVTASVNNQQPFFLYLSHYAVHSPHQSDPRFANRYADTQQNERTQNFATLVQGMDKSLGNVMDRVNELGVGKNTLILFLGDNGSDAPIGHEHAVACAAPLRGKKGSHYEGGVRVPCIAAWSTPDAESALQKEWQIAPAQTQTQMANVCDLLPTLCQLTSTDIPTDHTIDGQSLQKLLSGQSDSDHHQQFLMHFPHEHRSSYYTSLRDGNWKVIYQYLKRSDADGAAYQLFDLANDPFEQINLADKHPKKLRSMMMRLSASLEQHQAQYPIHAEQDPRELLPQIPEGTKLQR